MATKSTAARSRPIDRRRLPPPSPPLPLLTPYPMLPYNHPYVYAPPMGYMPPPTCYFTPTQPPMGYMPLPPPTWCFTPTQTRMGDMPHPLSSFVPPPLPLPAFWDNTYNIYTQTVHQSFSSFPPPPSQDNIYTRTVHQSSSFPPPPSQEDLSHKILKQIEYYFSDDNLAKDLFLKMKMDDNGWVPITLIAGFRRVSQLTKDIQIILDSLKNSDTVEVQADKVRRRTTWEKWIIFRSVEAKAAENVVPSDEVKKVEVD